MKTGEINKVEHVPMMNAWDVIWVFLKLSWAGEFPKYLPNFVKIKNPLKCIKI